MGKNKKEIEIFVGNRVSGLKELKKLERSHRNISRAILASNTQTSSGLGAMRAQKAIMSDNIKTIGRNRQRVLDNRIARQGFFRTLRMGQEDWSNFNKRGKKFNTLGGRMANVLRKSTSGLKGFRMEMLGVMFFGLAMQKMFSGLLKTSLQWTGVMDILSLALGVLFLPVALMLLKWALKFLKIVLDLSPAQRLWIGKLVLLGAALGFALFILGAFTLGIGALLTALAGILTPIGILLGTFIAIAALVGLPLLFKGASENSDKLKGKLVGLGLSAETFDIMKDKIIGWSNAIGDSFTNLSKSIKEAGGSFAFIKNKFGELIDKIISEEDQEKIRVAGKQTMDSYLQGVKDFINNNPEVIAGAVAGAWFAGPFGATVGASAVLAISKGIEADAKQSIPLQEKGRLIMEKIIDGINDNIDKIKEIIKIVLETISTVVDENGQVIFDIGVSIAGALLNGIVGFFKQNPAVVVGAILGAIIGFYVGGPIGAKIGATVGAGLGLGFQQEIKKKGFFSAAFDETILGKVIGGYKGLGIISTETTDKMGKDTEKLYSQMGDSAEKSFMLQQSFGENAFTVLQVTQDKKVKDMENSWQSMAAKNSTEAELMVTNINSSLDKIPSEVTTVHRIIPVFGFGGPSGGKKFSPSGATGNEIRAQQSLLPQFRAHGGPVQPNKSFIVGEAGPELFTPNVSGNITPNNQLGGGGSNITNNFFGFTMDDLTRELDARDRALVDQIRRGG